MNKLQSPNTTEHVSWRKSDQEKRISNQCQHTPQRKKWLSFLIEFTLYLKTKFHAHWLGLERKEPNDYGRLCWTIHHGDTQFLPITVFLARIRNTDHMQLNSTIICSISNRCKFLYFIFVVREPNCRYFSNHPKSWQRIQNDWLLEHSTLDQQAINQLNHRNTKRVVRIILWINKN